MTEKLEWVHGGENLDLWITANNLKELRCAIAFNATTSYLGDGRLAKITYGMVKGNRIVTKVEIEIYEKAGRGTQPE